MCYLSEKQFLDIVFFGYATVFKSLDKPTSNSRKNNLWLHMSFYCVHKTRQPNENSAFGVTPFETATIWKFQETARPVKVDSNNPFRVWRTSRALGPSMLGAWSWSKSICVCVVSWDDFDWFNVMSLIIPITYSYSYLIPIHWCSIAKEKLPSVNNNFYYGHIEHAFNSFFQVHTIY